MTRRIGRSPVKSLAVLVCCTVAVPLNAAEWLKAASPNFALYTTSNERDAGQALELFESVRDFMMRVKSSTTVLPVTIVGFRNQQEYDAYRINGSSTAYYTGDGHRDYIIMSDLANTGTAIHEYVHLLVRHSGLKVPVWLSEGFAEVYSTLRPSGGQVLLGAIHQNHLSVLSRRHWMTLPALLAVTHDSAEYNEQDPAGIFYAQSWLLAHMLLLSRDYSAGFPAFVSRLSKSGSSEDAFSSVYGKTLPEVEADLNSYFHQNSFDGILFKTSFQRVGVEPARPAPELEIELILARLAEFADHPEEAADRLQRLAASYPNRSEVEEALGNLDWRRGNARDAVRHLGVAVARGAASWQTYWDFAQASAAAGGAAEERIQALRKTLALQPDLVDARLMLGDQLYRQKQYSAALEELRRIKTIDPEHAAFMLLTMAYSAMELKQDRAAQQYAELAGKYARSPDQTRSAESLLRFVQQRNPPSR